MDATPSTITLQDINDLPLDLLPEEIVDDPFDVLSPADEIWRNKPRESFDANMSKAAVFHAWSVGRMGAVEAFRALEAYDLIDFDTVLYMLMQHHRTAQIIDGAE